MPIGNQDMHRIATTAIIFRQDGCVLILKRAPHKRQWPNLWTVPGGGFETDDYRYREPTHIGDTHQWYNALHHSVKREVREETGLDVENLWLVCDIAFIRTDGVPVVVLSYAADLVGSDRVYLDAEATSFVWVDLEGARHYPLIPGIYHELELAYETWSP